METSHQICIIFMLILIIIVAAGESGPSLPHQYPGTERKETPVAEPHRGMSHVNKFNMLMDYITPPFYSTEHILASSFGKYFSISASPKGIAEGCHFHGRWDGNWFQSGVPLITISRNTISTKGRCLEVDGEKYLILNERDNCFRCVVFHEKHYNLIQYKETFCVPERTSIRNLCSTITGDANLFTMFRLDAAPIDCPFRAPMTFTYNRGHGECRNPISTIESCIQSSRVLFNYQACPDVPGTESTEELLQCLASWKEGSYRYLVGLIQYRYHASYEEKFRCFVYEKVKKGALGLGLLGGNGQGYSNNIRSAPLTFNSTSSSSSSGDLNSNGNIMFRVSMSGDATCMGLSPYEGSRTMTFKRAQQVKQCYFPSWLQVHARWQSLDQRSTFSFNSSAMNMVNSSSGEGAFVGSDPNSNVVTTTAICSQILENPSLDEFTLVLHTTSAQCRSGYICARIIRRDAHVVELQMGSPTRQSDEACHLNNFNSRQLPFITLTSVNSMRKRCPSLGHFGITSVIQEGRSVRDTCINGHRSFSVGCSSRNTLEFRSPCNIGGGGDAPMDLISEYVCHGWWEEDGINYLITTLSSSSRSKSTEVPRKYCFVYRDMPLSLESKSKTYQKIQQGSKSNNPFILEEEGTGTDGFGRLMQFSSIADSCRRDVAPGIEGFLAFNVTSKGRCNDISGSSKASHVTELWLLAIIISRGVF